MSEYGQTEERRRIRVLIVAAYAAVRAGLHALLSEAEDLTLVGALSGSEELERALPACQPDVVVYDYQAGEGERLIEILAGRNTGLVLLGEERSAYRRLLPQPLRGWAYLLKEAEGGEIAGAIRAAAAGLIALDRSLAPLLTAPVSSPEQEPGAEKEAEQELTVREREVLQHLAQGLPNKVIAARLQISEHTVKFHVASILAKLGAGSRTEAVTLGARRGYVSL